MAECLINAGLSTTCDKKKRVGGVKKRLWIGNISELESIAYVGDDPKGAILDFTMASTTMTYVFEGFKQSHSGGYTWTPQTGGNGYWQHDVFTKFLADTAAEKAILEDLAVSDVFIILETNSEEFLFYGFKNGLQQTEGVQNSGAEFGSDTTDQLTFTGAELTMPKPLMAAIVASETQYEANLALLTSKEVAAP